ncbi:MAG: hypothetical protein KZQ74_15515 [gamma proteobacterium symbiont of Bathyaustriella thionipta]|nr:hypothetical protein [gamma proteobacterium symbiont of Bathyaustriella thionipta]MCU7957921.1 hypothetical protein [gamma proteobacterium symbiont of Bathyaustriella thionipta]MCU7968571.1 hypothetical protein [gamma proteobacterium symbiont of Bathyaustriella thionipta]
MSVIHRLGGDVTYADLSAHISNFDDSTWAASSGYRKETIRVGSDTSSVIIWEGHSKVAGSALLQLIQEGRVRYAICSSKRYRHYKLKYPIIRRNSDAVREYDKTHWVPINLYISNEEKSKLDTIHPVESQLIGEITVGYYNDQDYPVRVSKGKATATFSSVYDHGIIYDDDNDLEVELSTSEHNYLKTMKNEVKAWEDQFEDD